MTDSNEKLLRMKAMESMLRNRPPHEKANEDGLGVSAIKSTESKGSAPVVEQAAERKKSEDREDGEVEDAEHSDRSDSSSATGSSSDSSSGSKKVVKKDQTGPPDSRTAPSTESAKLTAISFKPRSLTRPGQKAEEGKRDANEPTPEDGKPLPQATDSPFNGSKVGPGNSPRPTPLVWVGSVFLFPCSESCTGTTFAQASPLR